MKKLSKIAGYVALIAVGASLIIITLVVILFLRDRKHEFGIYLSLGERKKYVLSQVIVELFLISLLAMTLSLITGNFLGQSVSSSLLSGDMLNDTSNAVSSNSGVISIGAGSSSLLPSISTEDINNAYSVEFTPTYIITFLFVGFLTVIGSAVIPLIYLMRLNPKKIMM